MARVVLSSKYAVMSRNSVCEKTRQCALLMFVSHNTDVTFICFFSDLVSKSFGGGAGLSPRAVSQDIQVARRACQPLENRILPVLTQNPWTA